MSDKPHIKYHRPSNRWACMTTFVTGFGETPFIAWLRWNKRVAEYKKDPLVFNVIKGSGRYQVGDKITFGFH